jgi:hypothetical protein
MVVAARAGALSRIDPALQAKPEKWLTCNLFLFDDDARDGNERSPPEWEGAR